jgi:hypothetical protein
MPTDEVDAPRFPLARTAAKDPRLGVIQRQPQQLTDLVGVKAGPGNAQGEPIINAEARASGGSYQLGRQS